MYEGKRVTVVLPALNEEEGIGAAVRGFRAIPEVDEVLVVDNGSTDRTGQIARESGARVVKEEKKGYGFACRRGLKEAAGDLICLSEPDGTFVPEDLRKLLSFTGRFDAVFGSRTCKACIEDGAKMDFWLRWGNRLTATYLKVLHGGPRLTDVGCTFKLFSRAAVQGVADALSVGGSHFSPELMVLLIHRGFRCVEVPVRYRRRMGASKITGVRWGATRVALKMLWLITRMRFKEAVTVRSWVLALSLLGVASFLVFVQASAPSLDSDGIHYAAVAKEIARSGRWLLPFDPVTNTPHYWHFPLSLWATALLFKGLGVSAAVAKLYSLGMTVVAVAGLFALGKMLSGPWTGWFAGMAFLATNHVLRIARQCRVDLPLVAWITWAFYGLVRAQGGSRLWYLLAGLASLGAVMTKEIVGLIPLVAGTGYLVFRRRWRELGSPAFGAAWVIALGPVLGWVALEEALFGDTLWRNYYAQNFEHLFTTNPLGTPWYYYGWAILDKYWYLLPFALAGAWIALQKVRQGQEPRWLLIFLWALAPILGFSLAQHKVHYYILPTYAATALWVGLFCERWIPPLWRQRILKGTVALAALAAVCLSLFPISVHKTRYPETLRLLPRLDPILLKAPGEVIIAGTDAASLLFYSDAVTRVTNAHHPWQFEPLLSQPALYRRYSVISRAYWNSLDPDTRLAWAVLEESDQQLLIAQGPRRGGRDGE